MITHKATLTTKYILPFIFDDCEPFRKSHSFVNAYVKDFNRMYQYENDCIFVVYRSNNEFYQYVRSIMEKNENYYAAYDETIKGVSYEVLVFKIPKKHKVAIELIKAGSVFNISFEDKLQVFNFWGAKHLEKFEEMIMMPKDYLHQKLEERGECIDYEDVDENAAKEYVEFIESIMSKKTSKSDHNQ